MEEYQSPSPVRANGITENLVVFRKFPSPSLDNSTTSTSSGGSPIMEKRMISAMVMLLSKSLEDSTEVFILHFYALQLLHELVNSNEFYGGDKMKLEVQIREIMDAMSRQLPKLDVSSSVQNFTSVVLKQVAGIVCGAVSNHLTI